MNMKIEEILIKRLSKKYNKKEKLIKIMLGETKKIIYNIEEFEKLLIEFFEKT